MDTKTCSLLEASFNKELRVCDVKSSPEEKLILFQLGFFPGEKLYKLHAAPWGDPITFRVGAHSLTLQKKLCSQIFVEEF